MAVELNNVITLKNVYGKVGQKYFVQPVRNPKTGQYPNFVKRVDSHGDMILTDKERNSEEYFIPETKVFIIEDGTTFDLNNEVERKNWEAIKYCVYIAPSREAKDDNGNNLIDGTMGWKNKNPRYGSADLYVWNEEEEVNNKVTKKDLYRKALNFIYDDPKGIQGRVLIARLLGHDMSRQSDGDVTDYLVSVAEGNPNKIIDAYTGPDTSLRLLFMEARDRKVIYTKNHLYIYADNIILGATDDAVITWMKDPKNRKLLELIKRDTYPDLYADEEEAKSKK